MSGTFDEKGKESDSQGKRPAPTIEGTATEVSVEPSAGETETPEAGAAAIAATPSDADQESADQESPDRGTTDEDASGDEPAAGEELASEPIPVKSEPPRRSFGSRFLSWIAALFTHALAGLAGGLAVLAALSWGYLPMAPQQEPVDLSGIEGRISALESAPETPDNAAALADLKSKLAALESQVAAPQAPAVDAAELEDLSQQVAQLQASLKSMAEAAKNGGSVADAAAISQQVAEAEKRLDDELQSKVQSEVEAALASGAGSSADAETIEGLKSEVTELNAKLKALTEAALSADDAAKLKPEIDAVQQRLGKIESMLPTLTEAVDAENAQAKRASLAVALSGLREAVNAGRPYAPELATLTALSPDTSDLGDLIEYEDTGIPTLAMLTKSFAPLRDQALAAQSDSESDLLGRLLGSAQSLVKVRRIGEEATGDSPDAVLARAHARLEAGQLDKAIDEVEQLRGPPAQIFGPWLDQGLARLDADAALRRLQDDLLVSLSGGGAVPSPATGAHDAETE